MCYLGHIWPLVYIALHFTACTNVQATNTTVNDPNHSRRCPSNITIRSKRYFTTYLRIHENGSAFGIFPPLLMDNLSAVCCDGQNISITFLNETSKTSVQKLLFTEYERRERLNYHDNDSLDFYFPSYTTQSDASEVYKVFYFIEVMRSPGPAFVMLLDEVQEPPDPSLILIECWPIFVLLLVMAWVVGIIGWFLVSVLRLVSRLTFVFSSCYCECSMGDDLNNYADL